MGGGISHCFKLVRGDEVLGGAVYGLPRHSVYGEEVLDLRRFACVEEAPKNTESWFLSKTMMLLRKAKAAKKIVTFADETQGHRGTIYKACNFKKIGETKPGKHIEWKGRQYHVRSLTIDRPYSYELREAVKNGEAKLVQGKHKNVFIFEFKT